MAAWPNHTMSPSSDHQVSPLLCLLLLAALEEVPNQFCLGALGPYEHRERMMYVLSLRASEVYTCHTNAVHTDNAGRDNDHIWAPLLDVWEAQHALLRLQEESQSVGTQLQNVPFRAQVERT